MCGRYYVDTESDILEIRQILTDLQTRLAGSPALTAMKTGEIFPSEVVPVIRAVDTDTGNRLLPDLMAWGFSGGPRLMINARSETAAEKPAFRDSLSTRRVLIPATAFFEWQKRPVQRVEQDDRQMNLFDLPDATAEIHNQQQTRSGPPKQATTRTGRQKYRLFCPQETVFYMAGLYRPVLAQHNRDGVAGEFVILTQSANHSMMAIHDRMPLVVPRSLLRPFLQDETVARNLLSTIATTQFSCVTAD